MTVGGYATNLFSSLPPLSTMPLRIAHFGDPQIGLAGGNKDLARFRHAIACANSLDIDVALIAGDLTNSQEDWQVAKYRDAEKTLKPRRADGTFRVPGNHDIWDLRTHTKFLKDHSMDCTFYARQIDGVEFIMCDTVLLNAASEELASLKRQHWTWLEGMLEKCSDEGRRHIFVVGHHPVSYLLL